MRISKNRSGKRVAEFSTKEYSQAMKYPETVSVSYINECIRFKKLPEGVISIKLGEGRTCPRILESTRLCDIEYVLNKNKK